MVVLCASEFEFAGHETHIIMLSLRATVYEFAGHDRHSDLSSSAYVPSTQYLHVFVDAFTRSEYFPAAQSVHFADPLMALYLPATQPVQLPFVPVQPALHVQDVILSLWATEYEFAGHDRHSDL